jgi:hypothetical protein
LRRVGLRAAAWTVRTTPAPRITTAQGSRRRLQIGKAIILNAAWSGRNIVIYFHRSASVAPGKAITAILSAREIAAYIKSKSGLEVKIGMPVGGNPNRIGWYVQYENLAVLEDTQARLFQDQKYMELIARSAENFIAGSVHDEIWRLL